MSRVGRGIIMVAMLVALASPFCCAGGPDSAAKKGTTKESPKKAAPVVVVKQESVPKVLRLMKPAPEISVVDAKGALVTIGSYKGKTIVLTFWDGKNEICVQQMKLVSNKIKDKKLAAVLIAISPGKTDADIKDSIAALQKADVTALSAFDKDLKSGVTYGLMGVPYFALIDPQGRLQVAGRMLADQKWDKGALLDFMVKAASGGTVSMCEFAQKVTPEPYKKNLIGKDAPGFRLKTLEGKDQSPLFYKGFSNLILVFWLPTCPHCRNELPRIEAFYNEYAKKRNVKIMGVVSLDKESDPETGQFKEMANKIVQGNGIKFPIAIDYERKIWDKYGVEGVPSIFIIDDSGKVAEAFKGESLFAVEDLECAFERLQGKK